MCSNETPNKNIKVNSMQGRFTLQFWHGISRFRFFIWVLGRYLEMALDYLAIQIHIIKE